MAITSLNRIIALLIVGSIPVIWSIFRFATIGSWLTAMGPVTAGPIILVTTVIYGVLIDSISALSTQRFVKKARRNPLVARLFLQGEPHEALALWRNLFQLAAEDTWMNLENKNITHCHSRQVRLI